MDKYINSNQLTNRIAEDVMDVDKNALYDVLSQLNNNNPVKQVLVRMCDKIEYLEQLSRTATASLLDFSTLSHDDIMQILEIDRKELDNIIDGKTISYDEMGDR